MRLSTLDERFAELLADPSADRYLGLREQLIESPDYAPYDPLWNRLWESFNSSEFSQTLEFVPLLDRGGLLSPRLHFVWGAAVMELADELSSDVDAVPEVPSGGHPLREDLAASADPLIVVEQIEWSQRCTQACLTSMLDVGDGTPEAPFVVTYPTDARDILRALRIVSTNQFTVEDLHGMRDVFVSESHGEIWFDVQTLLDAADRRLPEGEAHLAGLRRNRHPAWLRLFGQPM